MSTNNPYETPQAPLTMKDPDGVGDLNIFTAAGRLGRIRYLMYSVGVSIVGGILIALLAMIPVVGLFLVAAVYIALLVITVLLTIQRCHDFNMTGWLSLLLLIPIVNFVFYFWPGTKGTNNFGYQPPPNSKALIIGTFLLLALFIIILAAIALPAYQDYVIRVNG